MTIDTEAATLLRYLNHQRMHILEMADGLDDQALRRPVLPSDWNLLGLVQHLTFDVERFWFRAIVAGEQDVIDWLAGAGNAWQVAPDLPAEAVFDAYQREIELANAIIAARPPDAAPVWWPADLFGDFRLHTLREIILHVMTETACHTGHIDVVRELIDGRQWMVLTE